MAQMARFIFLVLLFFVGCFPERASEPTNKEEKQLVRPEELAKTEFAMLPGQVVTATTSNGTIKIAATGWLDRAYTWEGATRKVTMGHRKKRWFGSLGIAYPGPGDHWQEHNGITRGVLQEGQMHFESVASALEWIETEYERPCVYNRRGLLVGWSKTLERRQLNVDVWQIMIDGQVPNNLPGASDDQIEIQDDVD